MLLRRGSQKTELVHIIKTRRVIFNDHISEEDQPQNVLNKVSKVAGGLCKFRYTVPQPAKLLIYNIYFRII